MIKSLTFKFGSDPSSEKLSIELTPITVFVGPNNSGKSRTISEIMRRCQYGHSPSHSIITESIDFEANDTESAWSKVKEIVLDANADVQDLPRTVRVKDPHGSDEGAHLPHLLEAFTDPNGKRSEMYARYYVFNKTLMLDGKNRISLADDQPGGDLQRPADRSLQILFRNDRLRSKFREIIRDSLGSHAVIDPTNLGNLRLRLSAAEPPSADVERGLSNASVEFHGAAQHIAVASDGAKAFTGVIAEILAGDPQILLMDEPEAFLHPALAFNLGREISKSLQTTNKRMFVSTHSSQFLMGCIQSGVPINIVRLTFKEGIATARLLPSSEIIHIMRNPLLRSAGIMSAIFYESVVVTEADPDRAFYQEINERLLAVGRGIRNCIFLNAQNKQTIPTIIQPLRRLGIPSAAIYDIDFVKDGGVTATRFMESGGIPAIARSGLSTTRASIANALLAANSAYKTAGGITVLSGSELSASEDYFNQLNLYGIFVVRNGELESWLKHLGINSHGPSWLIPMFERMGENPESSTYISPSEGDVWEFLDKIAAWLANPKRRGIS